MRLICPHCQRSFPVEDSLEGKPVDCPHCHKGFTAPALYPIFERGATSTSHSSPDFEDSGHLSEHAPVSTAPAPPQEEEDVVAPYQVEQQAYSPPPYPQPHYAAPPQTPPPRRQPAMPPSAAGHAYPASPAPGPIAPPAQGPAPFAGYQKVRTLRLSLRVIAWLPMVFFGLAFLLSFFSWNGVYPGGYTVYSQSAWQALTGSFSTDPYYNSLLELQTPLKESISSNLLMFFYLVCLFLGTALATACQLLPRLLREMPTWFEPVWDHRYLAMAGFAGACLLVLLLQRSMGFGLENAVETYAIEKVTVAAAQATNQEKRNPDAEAIEIGRLAAGLNASTTKTLTVVTWLHLLALIAVGMEIGIRQRGPKPEPCLAVMW